VFAKTVIPPSYFDEYDDVRAVTRRNPASAAKTSQKTPLAQDHLMNVLKSFGGVSDFDDTIVEHLNVPVIERTPNAAVKKPLPLPAGSVLAGPVIERAPKAASTEPPLSAKQARKAFSGLLSFDE